MTDVWPWNTSAEMTSVSSTWYTHANDFLHSSVSGMIPCMEIPINLGLNICFMASKSTMTVSWPYKAALRRGVSPLASRSSTFALFLIEYELWQRTHWMRLDAMYMIWFSFVLLRRPWPRVEEEHLILVHDRSPPLNGGLHFHRLSAPALISHCSAASILLRAAICKVFSRF